MNARLLCTLPLLALAFSAGCAAEVDADDDGAVSEEELRASVTPGEFQLYDRPRVTPNPSCDVHTALKLAQGSFATATLEMRVGGFCEIAVTPNTRTYRLREAGTSCGSKLYEGSRTKNGERTTIKITDHRSRTCRDLPDARVIVEETNSRGQKTTLYSGLTVGGPAVVTGTLTRTFGIGGENTGTSIINSTERLEMVLTDDLRSKFVDGKTARATGDRITLSGVETRNRPAIRVTDLLVCPNSGSWVNCMPSIGGPRSTMCSAENRTWITANCPGVGFAF